MNAIDRPNNNIEAQVPSRKVVNSRWKITIKSRLSPMKSISARLRRTLNGMAQRSDSTMTSCSNGCRIKSAVIITATPYDANRIPAIIASHWTP